MLYLGDTKVSPTTIIKTSVAKEKGGVTIDNFIGDVDSNGNYERPSEYITFDGANIKSVGYRGFYYTFAYKKISSIKLSNLEEITEDYALYNIATYTEGLEELDLRNLKKIKSDRSLYNLASYPLSSDLNLKEPPFNKLQTIEGSNACYAALTNQKKITRTGLSNLISVKGANICGYMYSQCGSLTDIELDKLESISGSSAFANTFNYCTSLTRADFPSLVSIDNVNAFGTSTSNCIFYRCDNLTEIHFRADAQTLIESLTGYQYLFGASNATIYFDL